LVDVVGPARAIRVSSIQDEPEIPMDIPSFSSAVIVLLVLIELLAVVLISSQKPTVVGEVC
jgi:hypothetical protein